MAAHTELYCYLAKSVLNCEDMAKNFHIKTKQSPMFECTAQPNQNLSSTVKAVKPKVFIFRLLKWLIGRPW